MFDKQNMEQSKEVKLAYEVATALNDLKSINWHIGVCKKFSESFIKEKLADTLSRDYLGNPAAYYNSEIKRHGKHSRN